MDKRKGKGDNKENSLRYLVLLRALAIHILTLLTSQNTELTSNEPTCISDDTIVLN